MKVLFREARPGDENGIISFMKESFNRNNWLYTGSNCLSNKKIEQIKNDIKSKQTNQIHLLAIDLQTEKIIGSGMITFRTSGRLRHRVELGWGLHPDYQNQGIGTQLLNALLKIAKKKGFKRAEAEMAIENKASWKIALKCGFKIEGIKKKAMLTDDGRYIDAYIVGRLL